MVSLYIGKHLKCSCYQVIICAVIIYMYIPCQSRNIYTTKCTCAWNNLEQHFRTNVFEINVSSFLFYFKSYIFIIRLQDSNIFFQCFRHHFTDRCELKIHLKCCRSDTCMVAMETVTAFIDGPLCFMTAAAFLFKQGAKYRYVLQFAVSICQLYGDTIFFFTEIIDDFIHSEMWHPLHFWFYFFFLNIIWIIVPSINILDAFLSLCNAQAAADKASPQMRRNTKKFRWRNIFLI